MSGNQPSAFEAFLVPPLAAEKGLFQRLGDQFRFENAQLDSSDLLVAVAVIGAGFATVWLMATYMRRSERPKTVDNPKKLFQELCRVHRLERHEASMLRAVADGIPLENPSLLFIDPGLLDGAILDPRWVEESADLTRYRELFFGEQRPNSSAPTNEPAIA